MEQVVPNSANSCNKTVQYYSYSVIDSIVHVTVLVIHLFHFAVQELS